MANKAAGVIMTPHHITRITAENFMRLTAIDIKPDGNVIYITGANGEGKSSVLNAICAALNWRDAAGSIPEPIHKGEKKAVVTIDLGDMLVTRTWTPSGSQLKVESRDGAKYPTPQAMLDKFFSSIGFDPLEFIRMQPRDQRTTLMDLLDIDFSQYDQERAELLKEKATVSAQVTGLQQQMSEIPTLPEEIPDQEISASDILKQIQEGQQILNEHQRKLQEFKGLCFEINTAEDKIQAFEKEIGRLRDFIAERETKCSVLNQMIETFSPPDIETLQDQLTRIEETNRQIRQKQQQIELERRWKTAQSELTRITTDIDSIDQDKRDALEAAKFPVKGLTFDESGVLFQGVALKQASSAEQIRVSLAIGIAMNPALKFMIIRDGSLLDTKSRELVADMAAKHDMQVFIEAVDESGSVGFVIEDGTVRAPVEPGQQVLA